MTTTEIIEYLRNYNAWRRDNSDKQKPMPDPAQTGKVIDLAIEKLERIAQTE